jgi:thiamine biosynthesis lipoprotein ApbE
MKGPLTVRGITIPILVLGCCGATACRARAGLPTVSRAESALGAVFSVAAWGRDSAAVGRAVERALAAVRRVDSAPEKPRILTRRTGLRLSPERAARGLALDQALLALRPDVDSAILNLGGQYLIMANAERGVGIADPDNSLGTLAIVTVPPGTWGLSTVSPVEQTDAVLDPRTGAVADAVRAVTVVAPAAEVAGAWSLAFYVLGCDSALALAPQVGVGTVCADARVRWSPDLEGRVVVTTDSAGRAASGPGPGRGPARAGAAAGSGSRAPAASPDSSR